ncbi:ribonuclease HII [Helicobacter jaachi]|uniref:Ribonuclease n=1 Tax=Helicobacter jaachi TaxID=1677920 RepID=A0A4U8TAA1_9HELI|nr:ribonuclease HII [Helicobacter jaachi]TLD96613.1 ribonuclease HII [Helicobacter jaachi]
MWVAGIDEAGRGCICGGLFVAGVIGKAEVIATFGAKDSKKLTPKKRENIYNALVNAQKDNEIKLFCAQIDAWEIDKNGLSWAMRYGIEHIISQMGDVIQSLNLSLEQLPQGIILDGNTTFNALLPAHLESMDIKLTPLIKADSLMPVVSCASIVAKVHKDKQMRTLDTLYPHYKLAQNKGYGTLEHKKLIAQYGYCPHHRKSFKITIKGSLF